MSFSAGGYFERHVDAWRCPACMARPGHACQEQILGRLRPVRPHLMTHDEVTFAQHEAERSRRLLSEEP